MSLRPRRARSVETRAKTRASVLAALGVAMVIACQVIVPSELPDFACTGESASACPSGMVCDARIGRCVADGVAEGGAQDAGEDVDADAGDARTDAGPAPIGSPCRVDADCASKLCGTDTFLTPTMTAGTGPVCTQPCCTSADCPPATVCFGAGTGGNYCVAAAKAQRTPPATGGKSAGETCGDNNQCRSGLCQSGRCFDTCCTYSQCSTGTTCRVSTVQTPPGATRHDIWVCAPSPPGSDAGPADKCADHPDCYNANCIGFDAGRVCRPSCCTRADCNQQLGSTAAHCAYSTSNTDQIKFCFLTTNTLASPNGTTCGTPTECQSDYCDDGASKCLSICCVDSDCAATEACRPSPKGFLRCVPR